MNCKRKSAFTTKVGGDSTPSSAMANSLQLLSRWTFSLFFWSTDFWMRLAPLDFKLLVINIISVMIVLFVINLLSAALPEDILPFLWPTDFLGLTSSDSSPIIAWLKSLTQPREMYTLVDCTKRMCKQNFSHFANFYQACPSPIWGTLLPPQSQAPTLQPPIKVGLRQDLPPPCFLSIQFKTKTKTPRQTLFSHSSRWIATKTYHHHALFQLHKY